MKKDISINTKFFRFDIINPICMILLFIIGINVIYSATIYNSYEASWYKLAWVKQIIFATIGFFLYFVLANIHYKKLLFYAHFIYFLGILLLLPLFIESEFSINLPLVSTRYNSTRWIDFGLFSLQPSEIAKITVLIMTCAILARNKMGTLKDSLKVLAKIFLVAIIPYFLIFMQPDLGSSLVLPPMIFAILYISNLSKRFFVSVLSVFVLLISIISVDIYKYYKFLDTNNLKPAECASENLYAKQSLIPLKDYQRNRILTLIAPAVIDPSGTSVSWNINQSLASIGSGGIFGKGQGEAPLSKLGYLPSAVASNDFIFAVLAEEFGLAGSVIVLLLYAIIILNTLYIAYKAGSIFGVYLSVGVATILLVHIFINIGMTVGIMPITGLPLPLLSYGGSFVITCCILLGIVQSVFANRRNTN